MGSRRRTSAGGGFIAENPTSPQNGPKPGGAGVWWVLVILWLGVIGSFSAQDAAASAEASGALIDLVTRALARIGVSGIDTHYLVRKGAHVFIYAVLAVFLALAWRHSSRRGARSSPMARATAGPLVAAFVIAVLDESLQGLVDGRTRLLGDVGFDMVGALAGVGAVALIRTIRLRVGTRAGSDSAEHPPEKE